MKPPRTILEPSVPNGRVPNNSLVPVTMILKLNDEQTLPIDWPYLQPGGEHVIVYRHVFLRRHDMRILGLPPNSEAQNIWSMNWV
jgi:hypothetical protein